MFSIVLWGTRVIFFVEAKAYVLSAKEGCLVLSFAEKSRLSLMQCIWERQVWLGYRRQLKLSFAVEG